MKKILICGDSFCITDPRFPNFHWSEKLAETSSDIELWNFSGGGSSNALIAMQLMQGIKLNPDFVILSFTNEHRYETDNNVDAVPYSITPESVTAYLKERYRPNPNPNLTITLSQNFEKIKTYFYIMLCLQTLKEKQINFCFSLGGFEFMQDYTALLRSNFLDNDITKYSQHELATNLWYHRCKDPATPAFHVDKEEVHTLFANECFSHLNKLYA
jgi:hypothetical protein